MYAAGVRVDLLGQAVGIGGFELGQSPVVENQPGQLIVPGEFLEYVLGCRWLPLRRFANNRQLLFLEQYFLQLFW
ncbi:hypothetical protein MnTg04_01305 [bacterium MnTg04]|nr:hypothetical protein MnTg04_01305 [bacterium MnTg04]